jgi:hypothetical protein
MAAENERNLWEGKGPVPLRGVAPHSYPLKRSLGLHRCLSQIATRGVRWVFQ